MDSQELRLVYYSHSWLPEHIDINLAVWSAISGRCNLMVDKSDEPYPAYYISRIEDRIRRCDAFLAILPSCADRSEVTRETEDFTGSHYALFEIRLAERAREPRLVMYESSTRFSTETTETDTERYVGFSRGDLNNRKSAMWAVLAEWLDTITEQGVGEPDPPGERSATVLLGNESNRGATANAVRAALNSAGFTDINSLTSAATDVQKLMLLDRTRLLVADVTDPALWDVYGMAHARFVPTIRLYMEGGAVSTDRLPTVLRGHNAGFQEDVVQPTNIRALQNAIAERAKAIYDLPEPLLGRDEGNRYFKRRRN